MQLYTHAYGTGSSRIALLHGISGDHEMFADLTGLLTARGNSVIGVDLRGHGKSPRGDSYRIEDFASDLVETLPTGLDAVIGHSLGARVLLAAADRLAPRRAIYLDPAWHVRGMLDARGMHANVGEHPDGSAFTRSELAALNPLWGTENLLRAQRSHARWDAGMLAAISSMVDEQEFVVPVAQRPSLVIYGGRSPLYAAAPVDQIRAAGYEIRIQEGAAHNIHLDDAEATMRCLEGWI